MFFREHILFDMAFVTRAASVYGVNLHPRKFVGHIRWLNLNITAILTARFCLQNRLSRCADQIFVLSL